MADPSGLVDALGPVINVFGGIVGLTIIYGVVTIWQNKKALRRLERLERALIQVRRDTLKATRAQADELRRMHRRLDRWERGA